MAEAALASIAKSALQLFTSLAKDEFLLLWNSQKDLKRLEATIETINDFLLDAEDRKFKDRAVQRCLSDLRNVMYDAEDLFDALAAHLLRRKITHGNAFMKEAGAMWLNDIPWISLSSSLQCLYLQGMGEREQLPDGIQHLTSLQQLNIKGCEKLRSLPVWFPKLTSLEELRIVDCSAELKRRCERGTDDDWPLIRHITSPSGIRISEELDSSFPFFCFG